MRLPMRVLNIGSALLIAVIVGLDALDIVSYLRSPGDYRFGSEVAGFRYHSATHFVAVAIAQATVGVLGLAGSMLPRARGAALASRAATAGVLLVMSFGLSGK